MMVFVRLAEGEKEMRLIDAKMLAWMLPTSAEQYTKVSNVSASVRVTVK